jgi:hypothetical protein
VPNAEPISRNASRFSGRSATNAEAAKMSAVAEAVGSVTDSTESPGRTAASTSPCRANPASAPDACIACAIGASASARRRNGSARTAPARPRIVGMPR